MNFNEGVLSIIDPKGRYMGMQNIASAYLTGRCIHICTQGSKDNPTAIVIEVSAEEDRHKTEADKTYTRIKADYMGNANPTMFSSLLYNATRSFDIDKRYDEGNTYRFLDNNGCKAKITPEEFYNEEF